MYGSYNSYLVQKPSQLRPTQVDEEVVVAVVRVVVVGAAWLLVLVMSLDEDSQSLLGINFQL